jgi:hypothetical protein
MTSLSMLDAAVKLAVHHFSVFPVNSIVNSHCTCGKESCTSKGKHPIPFNGLKSATHDIGQIREWWQKYPQANIGLVAGKSSGFIIVDIDPRNGGDESIKTLEKTYGQFPPTKEVLTGGGGQHLYFRYPQHRTISCKAGKTEPFLGIDIKSDGGYVLAPPSLHLSGKRYEWEVSSWDYGMADIPEWFLTLLTKPVESSSRYTSSIAKGQDWARFLSQPFPEGQRNVNLTKLVGYFLRKKLDGLLTLHLSHLINQTCCKPPLSEQEVAQIVNSIALKESHHMIGKSYE